MKYMGPLTITMFVLFSQFTIAAPVCTKYDEISSTNRQQISDTRYELESLEQNQSDFDYSARFNKIINAHSKYYLQPSMPEYLQGLIAEAVLRRHIYQTIGLEHIIYKRFQIFADLILYHKAMDHKGFVSSDQFAKARLNLEKAINNFFVELEKESLAKAPKAASRVFVNTTDPIDESLQATAKQFVELETKRLQMLGSLEIVWTQLLQRNSYNQTEVLADLAITDVSINAATAVVGFAALLGYGPTILSAARSTWAMPLSVAAGCGFGMSNRYFSDGMSASYLEMSRALYKSVKNKTSFSCELGQQVHKTSDQQSVEIPNEKPMASTIDYLMSCAAVGASMVFPKSVGIGISGLLLATFASSSYQLVKESMVVLEELPKLYQLKEQAKHLKDPKAIAELEEKIHESKAKITLYLLAFGNTSMEAFRSGIFLYGSRDQLKDIILKAKQFIAGKPISENVDLQLMSLIIGGVQ